MKIRTKLTLFFTAIFFVLILSLSLWYQYRLFYVLRSEALKNIEMFLKGFMDFGHGGFRKVKNLDEFIIRYKERINRDNFSKMLSRRTWNILYDKDFNIIGQTPLAAEFPLQNIKSYLTQKYFTAKFKSNSEYFKSEKETLFSDYKINLEYEFYTDKDNYTFYCIGKISEINIGNEKAYLAVLFPDNKNRLYLDKTLINVIFTLLFSMCIIIIFGLFYSKYSLSPINKIISELNNISEENLSKRIKTYKNNKDEITEITLSINNLLERIEKAFVMEKQFISDVSHEFKTPIAILQLNIDNISNNPHLSDDEIDKITSSLEILYSLDFLIQKLLYLSKLESNLCKFNPETISVNELLTAIKNNLESIAEVKDIKFVLNLKDDILKINGDKDLLYIALSNIAENALKYTDNGSVIIEAEKVDNKISVIIEDTGSGIPKNKIDRIFDKFYRIDTSRHDGKSFGIGLTISKRILDIHNAVINIESIENVRTKFIVTFQSL